ncbi:MAG: CobW family GTP-binding protein [Acidimicrobiia bacterium]
MSAVPRIPFTLLGGYLGAGKTTLLNRLLTTAEGRRIVALVNDVGAVNVDAALVAEHDGATLTLTNGCVCCALGDDLVTALEQVRAMTPPPDQVVMELSGVGEPARLAPWADTTGFRLDGIVVLADADQIVELAERRYVGDTISAQLAAADLVLLTKTDLVDDPEPAIRFVAALTESPIHDAAGVDPQIVFGVGGGHLPEPTDGHVHHDVSTVPALGLTRAELDAFVAGLGCEVVRAKGLIRCIDVDHPVEVHVVGRRRSVRVRADLPPSAATDVLVVISVPLTD